MEAEVFQRQHFAVAQGFALPFRAWTDAIEGKCHGLAEEFFQLLGGGPQRILGIGTTLWTAKVRGENEARTLLDGEAQRREGFADARVIGDDRVLERNVEVDADEDAFAFQIEVVDGELSHSS